MILRPFKAFDPKLLTPKQQKQDADKNAWQPEYVFVHLFSILGGTFRMTAVFSDEFILREKRKAMKENCNNDRNMRTKFQNIVRTRIEEAVSVKQEIKNVNEEIRLLKLKRRIREKANIDQDFVV